MGARMLRFAPAILLGLIAMAASVLPARAELSESALQFLMNIKIEVQKAKEASVKILDSSQDPEAREAANKSIDLLDRVFQRSEDILEKNGY